MDAVPKKRYALIGTGGRAAFYYMAIASEYAATSQLVAFLDTNQTRMDYANWQLASVNYPKLPTFKPTEFSRMLDETKPNELIVTTIDRTHEKYITLALRSGLNVITEKPMTVDLPSINSIFDAISSTKQALRVTFNYRYAPHNTKVWTLLSEGAIGHVHAVHFEWMLNTSHGADYFRRWHRDRYNSGGLLVHKSTHHFDLINYWLQSRPETVFALGDLRFYGKGNAEERGVTKFYSRATGEVNSQGDPFALDMAANPQLKAMYLDAEKEDGYFRDQSVFGDGISIEDTMAVTAKYKSGAVLTYSLTAYSPVEGFRVAFTGNRGRLELEVIGRAYINAGGNQADEGALEHTSLVLRPMFQKPSDIEIPVKQGGHGGGDPELLNDLFGEPGEDVYRRRASHVDGALSILTGIAANKSIRDGQPVRVDDLITWS